MTLSFSRTSWRRLVLTLAAIAVVLSLQVGIFISSADARPFQATPPTFPSPERCDEILKDWETARDAGDEVAQEVHFLAYFWGRCGVWGEPAPEPPSSPGPSSGPSSGPSTDGKDAPISQ